MLLLSLNDKHLFMYTKLLSQKSADSDTIICSEMKTVGTTSYQQVMLTVKLY